MTNPQVPYTAQGIAELIARILSNRDTLAAKIVPEGETIYVIGSLKDIEFGQFNPIVITYDITKTPNSIKVMGPDSECQVSGNLIHALSLNVEDDLHLIDFNPTLRLRPYLQLEQPAVPPS